MQYENEIKEAITMYVEDTAKRFFKSDTKKAHALCKSMIQGSNEHFQSCMYIMGYLKGAFSFIEMGKITMQEICKVWEGYFNETIH